MFAAIHETTRRCIPSSGSYAELAQESPQFRALLQLDNKDRSQVDDRTESNTESHSPRPDSPSPTLRKEKGRKQRNPKLGKQLIKKEEQKTGAVTCATYAAYFATSDESSGEQTANGGSGSQYRQVTDPLIRGCPKRPSKHAHT